MGSEAWWMDEHKVTPLSIADQWRADELKGQAEERRVLDDAKADASAVWALAEFYVPPDLLEWGIRHRIPEFARVVFIHAFIAGWRAAHRAEKKEGA